MENLSPLAKDISASKDHAPSGSASTLPCSTQPFDATSAAEQPTAVLTDADHSSGFTCRQDSAETASESIGGHLPLAVTSSSEPVTPPSSKEQATVEIKQVVCNEIKTHSSSKAWSPQRVAALFVPERDSNEQLSPLENAAAFMSHDPGGVTPRLADISAASVGCQDTSPNGQESRIAALEQQLQAVSLSTPATPPAVPKQPDRCVGIVYDPCMELHIGPPRHQERPARTRELFKHISEEGLCNRCWQLPPRQATDEELTAGHTMEHVASVDSGYDPEAGEPIGDMYYSEGTAMAARTAAGSTIEAAEKVMSGVVQSALAVVRPPGHHAECGHAMGFCFYNNVVLAALMALKKGAKRILIFDWDVHHGNGTEHMLQEDPRVLYMSLHRGNGFYPGTGQSSDVGIGPGAGFSVNVPWLRGGVGDRDYLAAWELLLKPIVQSFSPDLILVSAGFDAAEGDPLGGCRLTPHGYGCLTTELLRYADGKCVIVLEGGYNTRVTSEAAAACLRCLLGQPPPPPDPFSAAWPQKQSAAAISATAAAQAPYWPLLKDISTAEGFKACWQRHTAAIDIPKSRRSRKGKSGNGFDFVLVT